MRYNSNSAEIQAANLNAISEWAKVPPPYRPDLEIIPIALVSLIHFLGDIQKWGFADSTLNPSYMWGLKFGLFNFSHKPKYSIVLNVRSQRLIISEGFLSFLYLAISVSEKYSSLALDISETFVPFTLIVSFLLIITTF
nr:hypothetical protein [Methanobrevibacter curvatus]